MRDFPHVLFERPALAAGPALARRPPPEGPRPGSPSFAARLKSDVTLRKISGIYPDHSYRAEISGDGITMEVRVIEYYAEVEGQKTEEMFCLITSLLDWEDYPAIELARLYNWRWDGSETALREAKAPLHGAGPGTGAMLRPAAPS